LFYLYIYILNIKIIDTKSDVESSAYTTPVGKVNLNHSASFSGNFNNYTMSNSSSYNSLSVMTSTLNNSSSTSTLNFIDGNGKSTVTTPGLKKSLSDFSTPYSSMVTSSIENATKISFPKNEEEDKQGFDLDSFNISDMV